MQSVKALFHLWRYNPLFDISRQHYLSERNCCEISFVSFPRTKLWTKIHALENHPVQHFLNNMSCSERRFPLNLAVCYKMPLELLAYDVWHLCFLKMWKKCGMVGIGTHTPFPWKRCFLTEKAHCDRAQESSILSISVRACWADGAGWYICVGHF